MQSLEDKLKEVQSENEALKRENNELRKRIEEVQRENSQLKLTRPSTMSTLKRPQMVLFAVFFVFGLNVLHFM